MIQGVPGSDAPPHLSHRNEGSPGNHGNSTEWDNWKRAVCKQYENTSCSRARRTPQSCMPPPNTPGLAILGSLSKLKQAQRTQLMTFGNNGLVWKFSAVVMSEDVRMSVLS